MKRIGRGTKKFLLAVCLIAGCLLLGCCAHRQEEARTVTLVLATDLHYLSPGLTDRGYYFEAINEQGDGRLLWYQQEIIGAFLADMKELKPDAVLLSGDLTYNGERESHERLAALLSELTEEGILVYVIPGNHDINNLLSRSFFGEEAERVESVLIEDFKELYQEFGYGKDKTRKKGAMCRNKLLEHSPDGLSYTVRLQDRISLYMLNTNRFLDGYQIGSGVGEETLAWLDGWLKQDQKEGRTPIAVGHHNLLVHNPFFIKGYVCSDSEEVKQVLADRQVPLYLSGHMHIQHQAKEETGDWELWDIAGSSLMVNPHQYGIVTIGTEGEVSYEKQSVKVEEYARAQGMTEEDLLHYADYAKEFFYQNQYKRVMENLKKTKLDEEIREELADYSARINVAYFAGMNEEEKQAFREDEGYRLWQEVKEELGEESFWCEYLDSILDGYCWRTKEQ